MAQSPPAWSMGSGQRSGSPRNDIDYKNIGPGSYEKKLTDKKKEPQYSMGGRLKEKGGTFLQSPGAGTYNLPNKMIESPGKSFGKRLETKHFPGMLGNGPAGYNVDKQKNSASFSMAGKLENLEVKKRNFAPGPGAYELAHQDNKNMSKAPAFKMGSETRDRNPHMKEQKTVPGAGTYTSNYNQKSKSPSFGFGSSKRPDIAGKRDNTPGPGNYKVPTKIADTANYHGIKQTQDYKHV